MTSCACCHKHCLGWHITGDRTLPNKCICGFDFTKQSITAFKGLTEISLSKAFTRNLAVQNIPDCQEMFPNTDLPCKQELAEVSLVHDFYRLQGGSRRLL